MSENNQERRNKDNRKKLSKALMLSGALTLGIVIAGLCFYDQIAPGIDKSVIDIVIGILLVMGLGELLVGIHMGRSHKRL